MLFKKHNLELVTDFFASFLPNDRLWSGKNLDSVTTKNGTFLVNLRRYLRANSKELQRLENSIVDFIDQLDPSETEQFLSEWESALLIPDTCIPLAQTDEERRNYILLKLTSLSVQTKSDFILLAQRLGFNIAIKNGIDESTFPFTFPIIFFNSAKDARYTMIVELPKEYEPIGFPFTFPMTFGADDKASILKCLFQKLVPVGVKVIFRYV